MNRRLRAGARFVVRLPRVVLVIIFRLYQVVIAPVLSLFSANGYGQTCRFYPSCSDYALVAVERHGVLRGGRLAIWRLLRCNPWNPGGVDHVPPEAGGPSAAPAAESAACHRHAALNCRGAHGHDPEAAGDRRRLDDGDVPLSAQRDRPARDLRLDVGPLHRRARRRHPDHPDSAVRETDQGIPGDAAGPAGDQEDPGEVQGQDGS